MAFASIFSTGSVVLFFDVDAGSNLDFANYALATPNNGGTVDPDADAMIDASTSGEDTLDGLINYQDPINNFTVSRLPVDITLTSQVLDPPAVISEGTEIKYEVTIQNDGPAAFNLSHYVNQQVAVFNGIFSGTDLEFTGVEDDLVSCFPLGPGSATYLGAAASDHSDYELLNGVGNTNLSDIIIPAGGSQLIVVLFTAKAGVAPNFNFYALNISAQADPDVLPLGGLSSLLSLSLFLPYYSFGNHLVATIFLVKTFFYY